MRWFVGVSAPSLMDGSLVKLVTLGPLGPRLCLRILLRVGLAGARSARRRMRRLAERLPVGVDRITRILPAVIGIGPFGGIGLAHRRVPRVLGLTRLGVFSGIVAG